MSKPTYVELEAQRDALYQALVSVTRELGALRPKKNDDIGQIVGSLSHANNVIQWVEESKNG